MKNLYITIIACLIFSSVSATEDGGTQSPFSFGFGARELSLGGANITNVSPATAVFWNSSQLALTENFELLGFHSQLYESDVAYQYVGMAYPTIDYGSFGLGISRLGVTGINRRDEFNFDLNDDFDDTRLGVYLAYGKSMAHYDIGMMINVEQHSIDTYKSTSSPGISFSASRSFKLNSSVLKAINSSVQVSNLLKPSMKLSDQSIKFPTELQLGISTAISFKKDQSDNLSLYSKINKVEGLSAKLSIGLEYTFLNALSLRGGLRESKNSYGLGLKFNMFNFDYALVDRDLGTIHMFSLTTSFGKPISEKRNLRAQSDERKFNSLMSDRLENKNKDMIAELTKNGEKYLSENKLNDALQNFERTLFLLKVNNNDTTKIVEQIRSTKEKIQNESNEHSYAIYLDSAKFKYSDNNFIDSKFYANVALGFYPASYEAQSIIDNSDIQLKKNLSESALLQEQLWLADSLIDYGNIRKAEMILSDLAKSVPDNKGLIRLQTKIQFEKYQLTAEDAITRNDISSAQTALESAEKLFPGHKWCLDFSNLLKDLKTFASKKVNNIKEPVISEPILSEKMEQEVSRIYETAQKQFENGDLQMAINNWEKVENIAPNYLSVRKYLINAYKYVGVELYGNNELNKAIEVWEKAQKLDPQNQEIENYIKRTINEISKMKELTYGNK